MKIGCRLSQKRTDAKAFPGERLQRVAVQLGPRVGQQQVIASGIDAGERVVVRDVAALADDQVVFGEPLQPAQQEE